jgi:carbohydrate-selective porin OprB
MKKTDYKKTNNTTHKNVVAESKTGIYRNTQDAKDVYTDIDGYRITTLKKRKR